MSELSTPRQFLMYGAFAAASLGMAACGAENAGLAGVRTQLPARASAAPAGGFARVAISIRWSRKPPAQRRPKFVSPSAMSAVAIVRSGAFRATSFANKQPGSKISTLRLDAPVGSDEFTVSLYDKPQKAHERAPAGTLLGQVSLVQTILGGKTNVVAAVVNGLVHSVTVAPLPEQPFLEMRNNGYLIVGQHAATFVVTARDADGNAILPPGITPSLFFQTRRKNSYFAVLPGANASQFTVVVTSAAPPGAKPRLTARAIDAQNTTVTKNVTIAQRSEVYVAYASGKILAFDDGGNVLALPKGAFGGLRRPVSLAYDSSDRTLFAADAGSGLIYGFTPDGSPQTGYTALALAAAAGVAWDSNELMNEIVAVAPTSGIIANSRTGGPEGDTAVESPFATTAATGVAYVPPTTEQPDALLVSDASASQLDAYTPYGAQTFGFGYPNVTVGPPSGVPGAIAVDPSGSIAWVSGTVAGAGELWRLALLSTSPHERAVPDANAPAGLAYDANIQRLFVAESRAGVVAAYKKNLMTPKTAIVLTAPAASRARNPQGVAIAY